MLIGTLNKGKRQLVSRFSQTVKLDVSPDGTLAESSKSRLIKSLLQCNNLLKKYRVQHYKCVGTAACRAIKNPEELISEVKEKTDIKLDIISPREEIKLACLGALPVFSKEKNNPVKFIFDIGGGSTDLGLFRCRPGYLLPKCLDCTSLPYGILKPAQQKSDREAVRRHAREAVLRLLAQSNEEVQVVSTSGPLASIVTLNEGLRGYHGPQIHGFSVDYKDALEWISKIRAMPISQLNSYDLSETVTRGLPILQGILEGVKKKVYISSTGVRHGLLRYLLAKNALPPQSPGQKVV